MADETGNLQGGQSQQGGEAQPAPAGEPSKDAKMWAMLCHLLAIFTGFIAPLIIWLVKKDDDAFVADQGKEALNFQITVLIAWLISFALSFLCIGIPLAIAVSICNLVFCILAAIKANQGEKYRYPVALRLSSNVA